MLLPFNKKGNGFQIVSSYIDNNEDTVYLTHTVKVASELTLPAFDRV